MKTTVVTRHPLPVYYHQVTKGQYFHFSDGDKTIYIKGKIDTHSKFGDSSNEEYSASSGAIVFIVKLKETIFEYV